MSEEAISKAKDYKSKEKKPISKSDGIYLDILNKVLSSKSSFNIRSQKSSKLAELKLSSIKRIFLNGQLQQNKYILYYLNKEFISLDKVEARRKEKEFNEETTDEESTTTVKDEEDPPSPKILNRDNQDIVIEIKNKTENIFNPQFPLLQNQIVNKFSNIEDLPLKYINLIIFYNKITLSLDYLKCFYLTIFFCGLFNLIYFMDILLDKNSSLDNLYHIFCLPLAFILMLSGFYGYKKACENIYDDKASIRLNYLCCICPICSFAFSRIYLENDSRKNIMMNFIINLISSFFSFFCLIILREVERVKKCEKNILNA